MKGDVRPVRGCSQTVPSRAEPLTEPFTVRLWLVNTFSFRNWSLSCATRYRRFATNESPTKWGFRAYTSTTLYTTSGLTQIACGVHHNSRSGIPGWLELSTVWSSKLLHTTRKRTGEECSLLRYLTISSAAMSANRTYRGHFERNKHCCANVVFLVLELSLSKCCFRWRWPIHWL
jgi:hypothetical protein